MATSGQEQTAPAREKAGRRLVAALLLLVALLLALVGALLWQRFYRADPKLEPNATVGMMPGKTAEQIEAELNQQISEGMIAFTINSAPTFLGGRGTSGLRTRPRTGSTPGWSFAWTRRTPTPKPWGASLCCARPAF